MRIKISVIVDVDNDNQAEDCKNDITDILEHFCYEFQEPDIEYL